MSLDRSPITNIVEGENPEVVMPDYSKTAIFVNVSYLKCLLTYILVYPPWAISSGVRSIPYISFFVSKKPLGPVCHFL